MNIHMNLCIKFKRERNIGIARETRSGKHNLCGKTRAQNWGMDTACFFYSFNQRGDNLAWLVFDIAFSLATTSIKQIVMVQCDEFPMSLSLT